jgi:hypothetical protein
MGMSVDALRLLGVEKVDNQGELTPEFMEILEKANQPKVTSQSIETVSLPSPLQASTTTEEAVPGKTNDSHSSEDPGVTDTPKQLKESGNETNQEDHTLLDFSDSATKEMLHDKDLSPTGSMAGGESQTPVSADVFNSQPEGFSPVPVFTQPTEQIPDNQVASKNKSQSSSKKSTQNTLHHKDENNTDKNPTSHEPPAEDLQGKNKNIFI